MSVKVYIAGPMTGLPEYNHPLFNEVAASLTDLGYAVLNPAANFEGRLDLPYREYMRAAVHQVLQADVIALLPGWADSPGARMETLLAQRIGLRVCRVVPPEPEDFWGWSLYPYDAPTLDVHAPEPEAP